MEQFSGLGKVLIFVGVFLILLGLAIILFPKTTLLGKLPGDIFIKGKNYSFYFPIATSILLSIVISLVLYLIRKLL